MRGAACLDQARATLSRTAAVTVTCRAAHDCTATPSTALNASAMALIDATAARLQHCWRQAGLTTIVKIDVPAHMSVTVRRYTVAGKQAGAPVCTIALFPPFRGAKLVSSFRAQCRTR